jgi:predicted GH43/DUF377 family glycosyl hydrolase
VHPWGTHVWISFSPDLRNSGGQQLMRRARNGGWRGANELGLSPPLMATPGGSLMIDHGVRQTAAGAMYPFGLAPLALDQRQVCLPGGDSWVLGPETGYDRQGDVGNVTFPCGFTIGTDGDTIHLYYGTADTCIAFATGSGRGLLGWLSRWGRVCAPTE